jgi:subtilisin-like proprotein convertase family protein
MLRYVIVLALATVCRAEIFSMYGIGIPTTDLATVFRTIEVPDDQDFVITDLNVILAVTHEDSSQLLIRLRHPDGATIDLLNQVPGAGFVHAVLDDEATQSPAGPGVHVGHFTPAEPLAAFDGLHVKGIWVISVEDMASGGQGHIHSCSLAFNGMTFVQPERVDIPSFGTVESPLDVPADVVIADAEVTLNLEHSLMLDLRIHLLAPGGAQSKLFDSLGAPDGLQGTSFDDQASESIDVASKHAAGRFRPTNQSPQPLALLDGAATAGAWALSVDDEDPVKGLGSITAWSLHIVPAGACADVAAAASSYGAGLPGALGVPALDALVDPEPGQLFRVHIGNSTGVPQPAVLLVGSHPAALPGKGGTLLVEAALQIPLALPAGGASLSAMLPTDTTLCGTHLYLQSLQADAAAPQGVAFSAGLDLRFGS